MTDQNQELPQPIEPPQRKASLRPTLFNEIFDANTVSGPDAMKGGEMFKRKRVTFPVPRDLCTVDFGEDFELTLQEVSAEDEMEAASKSTSSTGTDITMSLAKASLNGINGAPIPASRKDWLWEALGMGGRMLVVIGFQTHLSPRGDAEGKARLERAVFSARVE